MGGLRALCGAEEQERHTGRGGEDGMRQRGKQQIADG